MNGISIDVYIMGIVTVWLFLGLVTVLIYLVTVGEMISRKYDCGILEGIARFERAGDMQRNMLAVGILIIKWPWYIWKILSDIGQQSLYEMVQDNDYDDNDQKPGD